MADRMTINQQIQVGVEATHGTPVAAGKLLKCFDWSDGIMADVSTFRGTGHKMTGDVIENAEWMEHSLTGVMDFNGIVYPLSGVLSAATTALDGASSTAYNWVFAPPYIGPASPKSFTFQQGDTNIAHQDAFVLTTDWGYKMTRKANVELNGCKAFGQAIALAQTLTATPTVIALAPMTGKMAKIYLDTTSGGLGTTQVLKPLSFEFSESAMFGMVWFMTGNASFDGYADLAPKATGKLKMEADTNGVALLAYLQAGTTYYMRVDIVGAVIDGAHAISNEFKHDMAVRFSKPSMFEDDQGIFAIEWEFELLEDSTWGHYELVTVTNLLAAL